MAGFRQHLFLASAVFVVSLAGIALFGSHFYAQAHGESEDECNETNLYCLTEKIASGEEAVRTLPSIKVTVPTPALETNRTVTYSVETRGAITASVAEFKSQANETLNSAKGWAQLGIKFQAAASGGEFTLVLSEAGQVPSFSTGCDSHYSCNVGRYVIINQDRWLGATTSWNAAGGSLRDYRHMVINHETGHWLGHGHQNCSGAGRPAGVMQQQSINLQGCKFNPWPLAAELYSPRLGI